MMFIEKTERFPSRRGERWRGIGLFSFDRDEAIFPECPGSASTTAKTVMGMPPSAPHRLIFTSKMNPGRGPAVEKRLAQQNQPCSWQAHTAKLGF
jgi:hypothetical protein